MTITTTMTPKHLSLSIPIMKNIGASFKYACNGVWKAYKIETNLQITGTVSIAALILAWILHIAPLERCLIIVAIGAVNAIEMINTSIEKLCDHMHPERHSAIGTVKDVAAAVSLVMITASLVMGIIIFSRYVF